MTIKIEGREKEIRIPDEDIKRIEKGLGVSTSEAIDIWLEDEGYLENEEQEALCKKAKENRVTATVHRARSVEPNKQTKTRERTANPVKEDVIAALAETLKGMAEDVVIENIGKIITFRIGEENFKLDLIQRRKK